MAFTSIDEVKTRQMPEMAPLQKRSRISSTLEKKENVAAYLFLLPWFIGMLVFIAGPMVSSLYLSFTKYNLIGAPQWIGIQNYLAMFSDPQWWSAVKVTLLYVLLSVPLKITFAMLIALLLRQRLRGLGLYRAIYYVPSLLGGSVAIAILWRQLFDTDGVVNQMLRFFGILINTSWIASPRYALYTLVILAIWQFGAPMIIFLAGLNQIPQEYYDAASIDGAGVLRCFFSITVPLITPLIFFNMVLQMIGAFQAFTPAFVISGGTGGPLDTTLFYTLYIYQEGFGNLHMGYASAMAWILLIGIAVFTSMAFFTSRYWVFYQDERR